MGKGIVTIGVFLLFLGAAPTIFAQRPLTIRLGVHITPEIEKYLADQARDLLKGAGEGRLNAIPDIGKALN